MSTANPHHSLIKRGYLLAFGLFLSVTITLFSAYFLARNSYLRGLNPRLFAYSTLLGLCVSWQLSHMIKHRARKIYSYLTLCILLFLGAQSYHHQDLFYLFNPRPSTFVYFYQDYRLNLSTGKITLLKSLGTNPPKSQLSYVNCSYSINRWQDFFDFTPQMCVAFDNWGRIAMHFDRHLLKDIILSEIHLSNYELQGATLLGEAYQQQKKHYTFVKQKFNSDHLKEVNIYSIAEHSLQSPKVLESFTYDGQGKLLHFTLSSMLASDENGVFAQYNERGELIARPKPTRSFIFPSKVETSRFALLNSVQNLAH